LEHHLDPRDLDHFAEQLENGLTTDGQGNHSSKRSKREKEREKRDPSTCPLSLAINLSGLCWIPPQRKESARKCREREMRNEYLRMKTDYAPIGGDDLIQSDLKELGGAAKKLANHALMVGGGLGVGTTFFKFLASFAAMSVFLDFVCFLSLTPPLFVRS
ncbi:hypothetical protein GW17_00012450, partial [Ensete ventricosum]